LSQACVRFGGDAGVVLELETSAGRVWLVRHGESDWNVRHLAQGQAPGPTLTDRGVAQCTRAARVLAGQSIEAILSSDLTRARQSARILGEALDVPVATFEPALRERSLGRAEGRPAQCLLEHSGIRDGRVEDPDRAPVGGETIRQLYERATAFAESLCPSVGGADAVLVTHGGVIRVLLAWAEGSGPADMAWPPIANGAVVPLAMPRLIVAGASTTTGGASERSTRCR